MNVVLPGILFIFCCFNDYVQWIKNDVRSHSWGLISRYDSVIWLWRFRKDRRNLCQVSQCPSQDSKQPVLWLMWMETKRPSVWQVQHTCVSNSSKAEGASFHIRNSMFTVAHYKRMKISGEHNLSECIIRDLSYLTGLFMCINSGYKLIIYHIIDTTQHN